MSQENKIYNTAIYVRLSKEDGDVSNGMKFESDSISNQKDLISQFTENKQEFNIIGTWEDDGVSGVHMDRPGFEAMYEHILEGDVDCIIVKDLSRLGRNYVEVGRVLDELLDVLHIRIISVGDNIDTNKGDENVREMIIPFINIMNEQHAKEASVKTRDVLNKKRRNGEFIGSYAPYGYKKSQTIKNSLEVDAEAADVVKRIFRSYLEGYSMSAIAKELNEEHVSTPMQYKQEKGIRYSTPFAVKSVSKWDAKAVGRVLSNATYIGRLVQGKVSTPNYKVKKRINRSEEKWYVMEDSHEAIINPVAFNTVQEIMQTDTHTTRNGAKVHPYAGKVFCADCGNSMYLRNTKSNGRTYQYFMCNSHRLDKNVCSCHSIAWGKVEQAVLETVKVQANVFLETLEVFNYVKENVSVDMKRKTLEKKILRVQEQAKSYKERILGLYEDLKDDVITDEEYKHFKSGYYNKIANCNAQISQLKEESCMQERSFKSEDWVKDFMIVQQLETMDRYYIVTLISDIQVYENHRITVNMKYMDELQMMQDFIKEYQDKLDTKEAM